MRHIKIFDTTLRDGEQTPGVNFNIEQKIEIAYQLEKLGVDIIEAGFPITSDADFKACNEIAKRIKKSCVCLLARLNKKDIDRAYEASIGGHKTRLHIFIATSPIHMKHKLKMSEQDVLSKIEEMTTYAKTLFDDIEFSCEDASRSEKEFLVECYQKAIDCGATTINIPDTVGFATPDQIHVLVRYLKDHLNAPNIDFSIHIHQDLGLATANSLAAITAGCNQVECSVNGLGERAGNTPLEEIVCTLRLHRDFYDADTSIVLKEINTTSNLVATHAEITPQPNKAIVGHNAFLHESGIHQDGFLKARHTYEIINPEMIGKQMHECLVVGKHSGKHAMKDWLEKNSFAHDFQTVETFYNRVKKATDTKKNLSTNDLYTIINEILDLSTTHLTSDYIIDNFNINYDNNLVSATVVIKNEEGIFESSHIDETPIKALYEAINTALNITPTLNHYHIEAINTGIDAKGSVEVNISKEDINAYGHALSHDILMASVEAYINAINKIKGEF